MFNLSCKALSRSKTFTTNCNHSLPNKNPFEKHIVSTMASLSSKKKIVAVCQMTATNNKDDNIRRCTELIRSAKKENSMMVFLPEACDYIGESKTETLEMAEPLSGDFIKLFCSLAKENKIWVSLGGIHERVTSDIVQNSHVVIDDNGKIAAVYRKTHLFDVNLPEQGIRLMESDYVLSGQTIVPPVPTPVGNVGLSVCYDVRFPELSLVLSKMGADILTFPSAFTYVTGSAHWETVLRARAVENGCYVIAAAQSGAHNVKRTSWGHAMIVDPWGNVVAQCSGNLNVATAEIDVEFVENVRRSLPVWKHRRNDLYRTLIPKKRIEIEETYLLDNAIIDSDSIVYKTAWSLAFVSSNSIVPGHVLVIPSRYVTKLSDLNTEELLDVFSVVKRVQNAFEVCYSVAANVVYTKDGKDHLRIHVLPRRPDDLPNSLIYEHLDKHEEVPHLDRDLGAVVKEARILLTCVGLWQRMGR